MKIFFNDVLLIVLVCLNSITGNPIVSTKYGPIEGISVPIHTGQIIDSFMAVPYAKPPVGDLRFMVNNTKCNDSFY